MPQKEKVVVGVYLERNGGGIMRAVVTDQDAEKRCDTTHFNEFSWDPADLAGARATVAEMAKMAGNMGGQDLQSVAIAGPGPFLSLRRSNATGEFGTINPSVGALPLRGENLFKVFSEGIKKGGSNNDAFVTVHTDAEACAIGEAIVREIDQKDTLAFLLVTEGIGLGIVQGQSPLKSALHSEIGVLHVRWADEDALKPTGEKSDQRYARSLSEMADNQSLRRRFLERTGSQIKDDSDLDSPEFEDFWNLRAYYLAQACLACAVIIPPNKVVIGADIDFDGSLADRTSKFFYDILDARKLSDQPVFSFKELQTKETYIVGSQAIRTIREKPSFRVTGCLGMCYAAATAAYGGVHV